MTLSNFLLCQRVAAAEAAAQFRFRFAGEVVSLGPLVAVASSPHHQPPLPTDVAWLSTEGPLQAADLANLETFCDRQGQPATLHLLSSQLPAVLPLLQERNYRLSGALHLYIHELRNLSKAAKAASESVLTEREVYDPLSWAALPAEGFGAGSAALMQRVAQATGNRLFVAQVGSEDIATGALYLQGGVALLHGTSTRPGERGKGAQAALLSHRLHAAAQATADLASVFVTPGSVSERNVERAGFRLVGLRLTLTRMASWLV